jgi:FKBP-type peptidyl-prolyl cis-trans isomerase
MLKRNFKTLLLCIPIVFLILMVSCDPGKKYEKEEASQIQNYLSSNFNVTFVLMPSGLYYHETLAGTGASAVAGDSAFVKYTGTLIGGTVFDPGPGAGKSYGFVVGENVPGFDEGIMLMKVGGKATFLIPSKLAYGPAGKSGYDQYYGYYQIIPGYTPLLFDVELVRVKSNSGK